MTVAFIVCWYAEILASATTIIATAYHDGATSVQICLRHGTTWLAGALGGRRWAHYALPTSDLTLWLRIQTSKRNERQPAISVAVTIYISTVRTSQRPAATAKQPSRHSQFKCAQQMAINGLREVSKVPTSAFLGGGVQLLEACAKQAVSHYSQRSSLIATTALVATVAR